MQFTIVGSLVASVSAGGFSASLDSFEDYKTKFGKVYSPVEHQKRYEIFQKSVKIINDANEKNVAKNGHSPFGLTRSTDFTAAERSVQKGFRRSNATRSVDVVKVGSPQHPKSIDWTLTEAVTPIKNQGQCGSCWAFSATETIESHFIIGEGLQYGVSLSPQQVTSCTTMDYGCGGGEPMDAYDYVMSVAGLTNEWNWPYVQSMTKATKTQRCNTKKEAGINGTLEDLEGRFAQLTGYNWATPPCNDAGCYHQDLKQLQESVELGPVSVCVAAEMWDFYTGGVMTAETCGPMGSDFLDHCVQLVGFNKDAENPYWIVRNSWGSNWGENGNIFLELDMNSCGLADEATIPVIKNANPEKHRAAFFERAVGTSYGFSV